MYERKCPVCRKYFKTGFKDATLCYECYHVHRIQNHKEERSKHLFEIAFLQDEVNQLLSEIRRLEDVLYNENISKKIPGELIDQKILKDALFLCHPDRNENDERSRKVSVWLNGFREIASKNNDEN